MQLDHNNLPNPMSPPPMLVQLAEDTKVLKLTEKPPSKMQHKSLARGIISLAVLMTFMVTGVCMFADDLYADQCACAASATRTRSLLHKYAYLFTKACMYIARTHAHTRTHTHVHTLSRLEGMFVNLLCLHVLTCVRDRAGTPVWADGPLAGLTVPGSEGLSTALGGVLPGGTLEVLGPTQSSTLSSS